MSDQTTNVPSNEAEQAQSLVEQTQEHVQQVDEGNGTHACPLCGYVHVPAAEHPAAEPQAGSEATAPPEAPEQLASPEQPPQPAQ